MQDTAWEGAKPTQFLGLWPWALPLSHRWLILYKKRVDGYHVGTGIIRKCTEGDQEAIESSCTWGKNSQLLNM